MINEPVLNENSAIAALPIDRRAFLAPYLENAAERSSLYRFCHRLTSNPDTAEDLVQETLVTAWRQADSLQTPEYWRAWLYGIARNMVRRWHEKQRRNLSRWNETDIDTDEQVTTMVTGDDPVTALERQEIARIMDRALGYLPLPARHVLERHYLYDLPQAEIAAELGISENTAAVRLHRGREALRKVFLQHLRADATVFGWISPHGDERTPTHLWCPACGKEHLCASKDEKDRLRLSCSACYFNIGPHPIDFPSNCIFSHEDFDSTSILGTLNGYKPAINRMTGFWQQSLLRGQERGHIRCVGCGVELPLLLHRPSHLAPRPYAGFHTHCERCRRIHVQPPLAFVFCLPEVQAFWKQNPRMRINSPCGIANGRAFVMEIESVTGTERMAALFSADDYRLVEVNHH